eukprot:4528924-Amphidinium_carterae.1
MPSMRMALQVPQEQRQIIGRWSLSKIPDQEYQLAASHWRRSCLAHIEMERLNLTRLVMTTEPLTENWCRYLHPDTLTLSPPLRQMNVLDLTECQGSISQAASAVLPWLKANLAVP